MNKEQLLELHTMDCVEELQKIYNKIPNDDKPLAQSKIQELAASGFSNMWIYLAFKKIVKKDGGFYQ